MISALFMIAGIHSIANLRKLVNKQKKNYNPENTHSSFEVFLKEHIICLLLCVHFSLGSFSKTEFML